MKTTLVIGASTNPDRYSYKAVKKLLYHNFPVIAFGVKKGNIDSVTIQNAWDETWKIDIVTLYINSELQKEYYQKILDLKPNRIIFNPGTENLEFQKLLHENNIDFENACTLVLLSLGEY